MMARPAVIRRLKEIRDLRLVEMAHCLPIARGGPKLRIQVAVTASESHVPKLLNCRAAYGLFRLSNGEGAPCARAPGSGP